MSDIDSDPKHNQDRAKFEGVRKATGDSDRMFKEALDAFYPLLPVDQAALDKIINDVSGPNINKPITQIHKKRDPRNKPKKP